MMLSFHVPMSSTSVYDKLRLFLAQGKPLSKFREESKDDVINSVRFLLFFVLVCQKFTKL